MSKRYRLSPELSDGTSFSIVDTKKAVLASVETWCDDTMDCVGESCGIEIIEMGDKEYEALPDL